MLTCTEQVFFNFSSDFKQTNANFIGDISLLLLMKPLELSSNVATISLPVAGDDLVNVDQDSCVIAGIGFYSCKKYFCSKKLSTGNLTGKF